jgi:hypothetical protein
MPLPIPLKGNLSGSTCGNLCLSESGGLLNIFSPLGKGTNPCLISDRLLVGISGRRNGGPLMFDGPPGIGGGGGNKLMNSLHS